jgi:hypothetical protein
VAAVAAEYGARWQPPVTGFTPTFLIATGFLVACLLAGTLVPRAAAAERLDGESSARGD